MRRHILCLSLAIILVIAFSGCYGVSGAALGYYGDSVSTNVSRETVASGTDATANETESVYTWQEAYTAKLHYYAQLPAGEPDAVGAEWRFILLDIDQNGIPELFIVVCHDGLVNISSVYSFVSGTAELLKTNINTGFAGRIMLPPNDAPGIIRVAPVGVVVMYDKFTLNGTVLSRTGSGDVVEISDSFRIDSHPVTEEEFEYVFGRLDEKVWLTLYEITDANMHDIILGW